MAAQRQHDHLFKLLIIGNAGVGKSSLLVRFADNIFTQSYITTIGVDFKIRTIEIEGKKIKLQIWDTAGQERFRTITATYYRGAHGVIVVYDLTDAESFTGVQKWINEIQNHCEDVPRVLVGNKVDSPNRVVEKNDAEMYANQQHLRYFETSAKSNIGVEEMFTEITRQSLMQKTTTTAASNQPIRLTDESNKKQKKSCCK